MKTRFQNLWESLRSSYWFIPSLMLIGAAGLSVVMQNLDSRFQGDVVEAFPGAFQGGPDGARSMLATIAGSMITAAAVTFSITIAALATASSQFGPRLLRIFMQDTGSQVVLGTFLGTFIYCILALRLVPANGTELEVPHLSISVALALALASIGVLIYFVHHTASMLQVSHVAARVGEELVKAINNLFPEDLGWGPSDESKEDTIRLSDASAGALPDANQHEVRAERVGYVQAVDDERLMELAVRQDVTIRIALRPGAFIVPDGLLAVVWPAERATEELQAKLQEVFLVGGRRTPFQDIELYFDELIEIALRALSPGINDPYTALTCIDWLTAALATMARRRLPSRYRHDDDGVLRIIADAPELDRMIDRSFDRIRRAGSDHPPILHKLLVSMQILGPFVDDVDRAALRRQAIAIDVIARDSGFVEHERTGLVNEYRKALQILNTRY